MPEQVFRRLSGAPNEPNPAQGFFGVAAVAREKRNTSRAHRSQISQLKSVASSDTVQSFSITALS